MASSIPYRTISSRTDEEKSSAELPSTPPRSSGGGDLLRIEKGPDCFRTSIEVSVRVRSFNSAEVQFLTSQFPETYAIPSSGSSSAHPLSCITFGQYVLQANRLNRTIIVPNTSFISNPSLGTSDNFLSCVSTTKQPFTSNGGVITPRTGRTASNCSHSTTITSSSLAGGTVGNASSPRGGQGFTFDHVFWSVNGVKDLSGEEPVGQVEVYNEIGKPLVDHAFSGFNACLLAYGQTGSGKTYTMMGADVNDIEKNPNVGIIPRLCHDIFLRKEAAESDGTSTWSVEIGYVEVYNEKVTDLLARRKKGMEEEDVLVEVKENPVRGVYLEGQKLVSVSSVEDVLSAVQKGNLLRRTAATKMNSRSSRSHAILMIELQEQRLIIVKGLQDIGARMLSSGVSSHMNLVDLAGSERVSKSEVDGAVLSETTYINLSLTTLGRIIDILSDKKTPNAFVPFRDSKLTHILKDSLRGNSKTCMIATVSPSLMNANETLSTLRYASRARDIVNTVQINEDPRAKRIRELEAALSVAQCTLSCLSNPTVEKDLRAQLADAERQLKDQETVIESLMCSKRDIEAFCQTLEEDFRKKNCSLNHKIKDLEQKNELLNNSLVGAANELELCKSHLMQRSEEIQQMVTQHHRALEDIDQKLDMVIGNEKNNKEAKLHDMTQPSHFSFEKNVARTIEKIDSFKKILQYSLTEVRNEAAEKEEQWKSKLVEAESRHCDEISDNAAEVTALRSQMDLEEKRILRDLEMVRREAAEKEEQWNAKLCHEKMLIESSSQELRHREISLLNSQHQTEKLEWKVRMDQKLFERRLTHSREVRHLKDVVKAKGIEIMNLELKLQKMVVKAPVEEEEKVRHLECLYESTLSKLTTRDKKQKEMEDTVQKWIQAYIDEHTKLVSLQSTVALKHCQQHLVDLEACRRRAVELEGLKEYERKEYRFFITVISSFITEKELLQARLRVWRTKSLREELQCRSLCSNRGVNESNEGEISQRSPPWWRNRVEKKVLSSSVSSANERESFTGLLCSLPPVSQGTSLCCIPENTNEDREKSEAIKLARGSQPTTEINCRILNDLKSCTGDQTPLRESSFNKEEPFFEPANDLIGGSYSMELLQH